MKIYNTKVKILNKTKFISIPIKICDSLNINKGTIVKVSIDNVEDETIEFKCLACEHIFYLEKTDIPYCPICESENVIQQ